jgi:heterodisulfide reductase subunit A-like polyferredoxin
MQSKKDAQDQILVIGAGMAGIQASLTLTAAGKKVCLVEREPLFGGKVIKFEEVFPNMECSTCMAAPKQQDERSKTSPGRSRRFYSNDFQESPLRGY